MSIETVFAHVSCRDVKASAAWYEKAVWKGSRAQPMPGLVEWQFTESAEVQLFEDKEHAGHSTLTLGVLPLEPERQRLQRAGLEPGPIEEAKDFFIMRMRDPDGNLIVFASANKN